MVYIALLVGLAALFFAWRSNRAAKDLRERVTRLNSQIYDLRADMHRAAEAHQKAMMQLKFDMLRQTGELKVSGDMTVDEVTLLHPQAAEVLAAHHIGGCASCAVDGSTRLDRAVAANAGQLEPVLVALNSLVDEGSDGLVAEDRLRTPNVQLSM